MKGLDEERRLLKIQRAHHKEVQRGRELDAELDTLKSRILEEKAKQASFGSRAGALKAAGSSNLAEEARRYKTKILSRLEELFATTLREENALTRETKAKRGLINDLRSNALALNEEFLLSSNSLDSAKLRLALILEQANSIVKAKGEIALRVEALRKKLVLDRTLWLQERAQITGEVHRLLATSALSGNKGKKRKHAKLLESLTGGGGAGGGGGGLGASASAAVLAAVSARPMTPAGAAAAAPPPLLAGLMARKSSLTPSSSAPVLLASSSAAANRLHILTPMTTTMLRHGVNAFAAPPQAVFALASDNANLPSSSLPADTARPSSGLAAGGAQLPTTAAAKSTTSSPPSLPPSFAGAVAGSLTPQEEEKLTAKARRLKALHEALVADAPRQEQLLARWEAAFDQLWRSSLAAAGGSTEEEEEDPLASLSAMVPKTPSSPMRAAAQNRRGSWVGADEGKNESLSMSASVTMEGDDMCTTAKRQGGLSSYRYESIVRDPHPVIEQFLKHDAHLYGQYGEIAAIDLETEAVERQKAFLLSEVSRLAAERAQASRLAALTQLEGRLAAMREMNKEAAEREKVLAREMESVLAAVNSLTHRLGSVEASDEGEILTALGAAERRAHVLTTELASLFPSSGQLSSASSSVIFSGSSQLVAPRPPSVGGEDQQGLRALLPQVEGGDVGMNNPANNSFGTPLAAALAANVDMLRKNRRASLASVVDDQPTQPPSIAHQLQQLEAQKAPEVVARPGTSYSRGQQGASSDSTSASGRKLGAMSSSGRAASGGSSRRGSFLSGVPSGGATNRTATSSSSSSSSARRSTAEEKKEEGHKQQQQPPATAVEEATTAAPDIEADVFDTTTAANAAATKPLFLLERIPGKSAASVARTLMPLTPSAVASAIKARTGGRASLTAAPAAGTGTGAAVTGGVEPLTSPSRRLVPLAMTSLLTTQAQRGSLPFFSEAAIDKRPLTADEGNEERREANSRDRRLSSTSSASSEDVLGPAVKSAYLDWLRTHMPETHSAHAQAAAASAKKKAAKAAAAGATKQRDERSAARERLALRPYTPIKLQAPPAASQRGGLTRRPVVEATLSAPMVSAHAQQGTGIGAVGVEVGAFDDGDGALGEINSALMQSVTALEFDAEQDDDRAASDDDNDFIVDEEDVKELRETTTVITNEVDRALLAAGAGADAGVVAAGPVTSPGHHHHHLLLTKRVKTRELDNLEKVFTAAEKASTRLSEAERTVEAVKTARIAELEGQEGERTARVAVLPAFLPSIPSSGSASRPSSDNATAVAATVTTSRPRPASSSLVRPSVPVPALGDSVLLQALGDVVMASARTQPQPVALSGGGDRDDAETGKEEDHE